MRKLWLRFVLWNNNICSKHGPMQWAHSYYCHECNTEYRRKRQERFEQYRKEVNAYKF